MSIENSIWFSQTTLMFKDKQYSTNGYLRLSITCSTEDYKSFSPPRFSISISNQITKSCNLDIQNAEDLLESFTTILKQLNGDNIIVEKHYQKNSTIFFKFAIASTTNERVVIIEIISSETDVVKIIVPLKPIFQSFLRRLKYFVEYYDQICFRFLVESFNGESKNIIQQLPSLIKGISSQIVPIENPEQEVLSTLQNVNENLVKETAGNILDLDKFIGKDMENIKIPEIDEKKIEKTTSVVEIESIFVNKILQNDLYNLENKLTSFAASTNPMINLATNLQSVLNFELLNGINENDKKSLVYISLVFQHFYSKTYIINTVPIPSTTPILKFKGKNNIQNIEFAKDLLVIIGYMRIVRRKLESKTHDAYNNKSMVYLFLRCMMDPFCFSYLDGLTRTDILASIENRYSYFNSIKVFDKYKQILKNYRCPEVELNDIVLFSEEVVDNIIGKTPTIDILHEQLVLSGNLKLPSKNILTIEQIINEFVPMEVNEKLGADYKNPEVVNKIKKQHNISDEIINFFIDNCQKLQQSKIKKITPLQRWINKFKQDIPDVYRDDVISFVENIKYNKIDLKDVPWPLEEFDERIIKALYIWDPTSDEKMRSDFEYFASLIENEIMTKESILLSIQAEYSNSWNKISELV